MEGITFTPEQTEETGISYENKPVISTNEAKLRANQIQVAFGESVRLNPQEVQNVIEFDGTDSSYREILKQIEADALRQEKGKVLQESLDNNKPEDFVAASSVDENNLVRSTETNLEEIYSENILNTAEAVLGDNEAIPSTSLDTLRSWAEDQAFNVTLSKQAQAKYEQEDTDNPLGDIADFTQGLIPFRSGALLSNEVEGADGKFFQGTGQNLLDQIEYIKSIEDKAERKRVFNETVDKIAESSLDAAQEFANYFSTLTDSGATEVTILTEGMDLLDVATLGGTKALKSVLKGTTGLTKGIVKGMARKDIIKGIAEETVDAPASVAVSLARKNDVTKTPHQVEVGELYDTYYSVFNTDRIFTGESNLTAGAQQAIRDHLQYATSEMAEKLRSQNFGVDRVSPLELKYAVEALQTEVRQDFKGIRFANIADSPTLDPVTNTYRMQFDIGRKDGSLFASEKGAQNYADKYIKLKTSDYEIFEQGGKWGIRIEKDVPEFEGFLRGFNEIETTEKFNDSLPNLFLGRLRESGSVEGKGAFNTKLAALHGAQDMYKTFEVVAKPYFDLMKRKEDYNELGRVFNYLRETVDKKTGQVGRWADTDTEFEDIFFMQNGKLPSAEQQLAYWSYRQASDIEKILADTSRHATYVRLGAKRISASGKMGKEKVDIEGNMRIVDTVDLGGVNDYFKMAIIDKNGNIKITSNKGKLDDLQAAYSGNFEIAKAVEGSGVKVGKSRVHYILSESGFKKDNLKLSDTGTGYTGGGHLMNEHPFYVKIANISDDVYTGDEVLVNAFSLKQAQEIAENFNKAKNLFLNGKTGWKKIVDDQLPFITPEDFKGLLKDRRADVDAVGIRAGQRTVDSQKLPQNVLRYDNSRFDELGDYERRFAEERTNPDLKIMREEVKGKYTVETAPKLDPGMALQKGMNVAVTARMQKDSLVRGVSAWTKQFSNKLNENWTPEKIWQDPMGFLNDPDPYLKNAWQDDAAGRWQAETARQAMLRQIDYGTVTSRAAAMLTERIHTAINGKGQKKLPGLHKLPSVKDPLVFARELAYNAYLGLFNIQQIAVQGVGTMHLAAIAPRFYTRGVASAMALRSATYTTRQNILSHFGKSFSKHTGLKADEFVKMARDMRTSGWSEMGGSMAQIADDVTGNIVSGKLDKALDWGRVIPTSIDRFHRLAAWSVAWMEKQAAKGSTDFTRTELQEILRRANVLSGNMSSANNAAWQRGALAPATQFMSYPLRIMEQVLPALTFKPKGDLTRGEAYRVVALQSLAFGIPLGGFGAAAGPIWNFDETIREQAYKQWGFEIDDSYAEWLMDGVPSTLVEWLSSSEGLKDGVDIDLSRLALGQESIFQRLLSNEISISEFFGGAAGGFIGGMAKAGIVDPVWNAYIGATSTSDYDYYPIMADDIKEAARKISTIDVAFKARDALYRGVWTSRTGMDETEVGFGEAIGALVTGGTPQAVTLSRLRRGIMYEDKERDSKIRKLIKEQYSKGLKAGDDYATRRSFFGQAKAIAEYYNIDDMTLMRLISAAGKEQGMRADRIEELFYKDGIKRGKIKSPLALGSE